jgi:hypothetical protein
MLVIGNGESEMRRSIVILLILNAALVRDSWAGDPSRGYELLLTKAYVAPAFDEETFGRLWESWEEPLRSWAAKATPADRRRMAFRRYGLDAQPGDPQHRPLQYVVDDAGRWTINCLACHQGSVAGRLIPGAANTRYALETLTADVRATKLREGKPFGDMELGSLVMPLGTTNGTTNAVMFGVALMSLRDADMNIHLDRPKIPLSNHDHDAPAWWNTARKERLYCDNFAPRGHRALMQFIETTDNGPEKFREWEDDFRHIESYIASLETPKFPFPIDRDLAAQGQVAFDRVCAGCHGTYDRHDAKKGGVGEDSYPERIVPIEEVRTDPVRLNALSIAHRRDYGRNWINEYGKAGDVVADPGGYLAPPLNGVWASAPYFHNGSVPTLWHVLHPDERPVVWARTDDQNDPQGLDRSPEESMAADYDAERVGVAASQFDAPPPATASAADRHRYFDTRRFGKSATGHDFPNVLDQRERRAVLEYLKAL